VSTYIIVEEPPFTDAELQQVYAGIGAFDPPELGPRDHRPLAVAMRDAAGRLCGALAGATRDRSRTQRAPRRRRRPDMTTTTLTALYDSRAEADQAAERLVREAGVARADATVHAQDAAAPGGGATSSGAGESTGFFGSLKNLFMPEEDRNTYSEAISRGGFLLTARVEQSNAERATAILEEHGAVDLDDRQATWRAGGSTGGQQAPPMAAQTLADGTVVATPDRARFWQAQTPQGFPRAVILEAHRRARAEGVRATDDAALCERYGIPVRVVEGAADNLKVTRPADLAVAEALARRLPD